MVRPSACCQPATPLTMRRAPAEVFGASVTAAGISTGNKTNISIAIMVRYVVIMGHSLSPQNGTVGFDYVATLWRARMKITDAAPGQLCRQPTNLRRILVFLPSERRSSDPLRLAGVRVWLLGNEDLDLP